jgi:hypothetical protein
MKSSNTVMLPPGRYILARQSPTNPQVYILKQDAILVQPGGGTNTARRVAAGAIVVTRISDPWRVEVTDRETNEVMLVLDADDVAAFFPPDWEARVQLAYIEYGSRASGGRALEVDIAPPAEMGAKKAKP